MSSPYNLPDYRKSFEHKTLSKIHGEPDIDSLSQMFREVKRNSQKVKTTLGGGQHGYLALVLSNAAYTNIPGTTAFNRPTDPGPFDVEAPNPTGGVMTRAQIEEGIAALTAADITRQKIKYDERLRLYNECQAVESALRDQITEAIQDEYLDSMRDSATDMINESIPDIFTYLQTTI